MNRCNKSWFWHFGETFPSPFKTSFSQSSQLWPAFCGTSIYLVWQAFSKSFLTSFPQLLFPNDHSLTRLFAFKNRAPEHEAVKISFLCTFKDASRYVLNSKPTLLVHQWQGTWRINIYRYRCRYRYDFYPTHQNSKM